MLQTTLKGHLSFSAFVVIAVALAGAPEAQAGEWKWEIVPYAWMADVGVDISLNETDIGTTVDFSDVIEKLDFAVLFHFEGHKGRGGLFVDVAYLSVSDDQTTSGGPPIPAGTIINTELDQLVSEAGGIYRLTGDEQGLELLFGARVLDLSLDVSFDFPATSMLADRSRSGDKTLFDGFVGLRYRDDISDRWLWSIRGDVGGGDTDLTWQGVLTFGAKLGKNRNKTLYLAYRHLAYEFEAGTSGITDRDVEFTGPAVGFGFSF